MKLILPTIALFAFGQVSGIPSPHVKRADPPPDGKPIITFQSSVNHGVSQRPKLYF
jgi:hypothetical protein